jgi:hypothetical protein
MNTKTNEYLRYKGTQNSYVAVSDSYYIEVDTYDFDTGIKEQTGKFPEIRKEDFEPCPKEEFITAYFTAFAKIKIGIDKI